MCFCRLSCNSVICDFTGECCFAHHYVGQCISTFLLQWNLPQMFVFIMEPYAMIQVSILLQPHRTVVANFVLRKFGLFRRNPWQPLAEPQLKNTDVAKRGEARNTVLPCLVWLMLNPLCIQCFNFMMFSGLILQYCSSDPSPRGGL